MKLLEDLLTVVPSSVLRVVLAMLELSPACDRLRQSVAVELRFRELLAEDLANEAGAAYWGVAPVGLA